MDVSQFQLFKQITLDYFAKLAPAEPPALEAPYLQFGGLPLLDYAALVRVVGELSGCLYLTSPVPMLQSLLQLHGEPEVSERTLRDMCRELSNVLSGNASQAFGGEWEISVPYSLDAAEFGALTLPPSAFVMPLRWRGATALLVVGLEPRRPS
jgi:hypothetical protein